MNRINIHTRTQKRRPVILLVLVLLCFSWGKTFAQSPMFYPNGAVNSCGPLWLTATSAPSSGVFFQWYKDGSPIFGQTGQSLYVTEGGHNYYVKANGATPATIAIVTFYSKPAQPSISPGSGTYCDAVTLYSTTPSGTSSYQWNLNGSPVSGATSSSYTTSTSGSYTVTVSNGTCDNTSDATSVTIVSSPVAPTVTQSGNGTYCGSGVLTAYTPSTIQSYQWYVSAPISGETNSTYTVTQSGQYVVRVTDYQGCTSSSSYVDVTVNAAPAAPSVDVTGPTCGDKTLTANPASGTSYQWYLDGSPISGSGSSITATQSGNYSVQATLGSCTSAVGNAASVTVNVIPERPTILGSASRSGCTSVTLSTSPVFGSSYQWYRNGSALSGETGTSCSVTSDGYYTVTRTQGICQSSHSSQVLVTITGNPAKPSISYSGGAPFCGSLDLTTSSTAVTYQWLNYDSPVGGNSTSYTAGVGSGSYQVRVTDGSGCFNTSDPVSVTVYSYPVKPTISQSGNGTYCGYAQLQANVFSTVASYQWYISAPIPGATNTSYTANNGGPYTVRVTSYDGCTSSSDELWITVNTVPAAPVLRTDNVHCGSSLLSIDAVSGADSYQWFLDDSPISGATGLTYSATQSGRYKVQGINTSGSCPGIMSNFLDIVVYAIPSTPSIAPSGTVKGCTSVLLTTQPMSGSSYQWYSSGSPISGATGTSYTATSNGFYTLSRTENNCQSAQSSAAAVFITGLPLKPSISPSGSFSVCDNVNLSTSATGVNYQWYKYGTAISGANAQTYNVTSSGSYQVEIIDGEGCPMKSDVAAITVNASPVKPTISQPGNGTYCGSGLLSAYTPSTASYKWYLSDEIPGATGFNYTAYNSGIYVVRVTSPEGCTSSSDYVNITVNPLPATPTITQTGNGTYCGIATLTAATISGANYQWFLDGSQVSGVTGASYPVTTSGSYSVRAVNSTTGCVSGAYDPVAITVKTVPSQPSNIPSGSVSGCTSVTLRTSEVFGASYQWYSSGALISDATGSSYAANTGGDYSVVLTVNQCPSAASTPTHVTITGLPSKPTVTPSGDPAFCNSGTLTASVAGMSYQWYQNATAIPGAVSQSYLASNTGTYYVTITDGNGCSNSSAPKAVTVNTSPTAPTISPSGSQSFCASGILTASAVSGMNYQWLQDGAPANGATSQSYTAIVTAVYSVRITNTTTGCHSTSGSVSVTINPLPPIPTIDAGGITVVCAGNSVVLTSTAAPAYQWYKNGELLTGATASTYTASTTGNFAVRVTDNNGCANTSAVTAIAVNALPPTPVITTSGSTAVCPGESVVLISNAPGNNQWYRDGLIMAGATNTTYVATIAGDYTVRVTNASGCSATSTATTVTVKDRPELQPIVGLSSVCQGASITLTNATPGGTWSSNAPSIAYANANGIITGVTIGKAVIKYSITVNGCSADVYKPVSVIDCNGSCVAGPIADLYSTKTRIFDEYINSTGKTMALLGPLRSATDPAAKSLTDARAEALNGVDGYRLTWSNQLHGMIREQEEVSGSVLHALADTYAPDGSIVTKNSTIENVLDGLVALVKVHLNAATSVDQLHVYSQLPPGETVVLNGATCNSFADVFAAYVSSNLRQAGFSQDLLTDPYPYDKQPFKVNDNTATLSSTICDNVSALKSRWQTAGTPATFHDYLKQELGDDYTLTSVELQDIEAKCAASCNVKLLNEFAHLPVAFTAVSTARWNDCNTISAAIAEFNAAYPSSAVATDSKLYRVLYTNFLNHKLGFALSYDEYASFATDRCTVTPTALLYNKPQTPQVVLDEMACTLNVLRGAFNNAGAAYDTYITAERVRFRNDYTVTCLDNRASVNLEAALKEYHYTLYYYDLSGNLVKTIPPAGVKLLTDQEADWVNTFREQNISPTQCDGSGVPTTEDADAAFSSVSSGLSAGSTKSMELWLYSNAPTGQQVRMVTPDNKFMVQSAIKDNRIWVEVYSLQSTATPAEIKITLTNRVSAPVSTSLGIMPWTHLVIQSADGVLGGQLQVYANGTKLTTATNDADPYPFEWSIVSGSSSVSMPANDIAVLKHLRLYNRTISDQEVLANFRNSCLSPVDATAVNLAHNGIQELWARFNIPSPGGPTTIASNSSTEYIKRFIVPAHALPVNYSYNSLNQVVQQHTPDGGASGFWYDRLGRLAVSQNAEQKQPATVDANNPAGRYSYTLYDALGRITEVGEKLNGAEMTETLARDTDLLNTWNGAGQKRQVTLTAYDLQPAWVPLEVQYKQENLRHRVAATLLLSSGDDPNTNRVSGSYYHYDIVGNVGTLWQENSALMAAEHSKIEPGTGLKRIDYDFDLISGKVNKVKYQEGKWDQFFYQYIYDADNRLVTAYSNRTNEPGLVNWRKDAHYRYYLHGPLARTELGEMVQGLDYAYTLQGWLKGVNGVQINGDGSNDMSADGHGTGPFSSFNRDAIGFTLGYYDGDYKPIGQTAATAFLQRFTAPGSTTTSGQNFYNGNISSSSYAIAQIDNGNATGQTYRYDQLNRLTASNRHGVIAGNGQPWASGSLIQAYREQVSYDPNGNILTYLRNGAPGHERMDDLTYGYNRSGNGDLINNRLRHVKDAAGATGQGDLGDQGEDNYSYDKIGNLKTDNAEGIDKIEWNVYGKINAIRKTNGTTIGYGYDATGNRVSKTVTTSGTPSSTYYVRDAQGNTLGVYSQKNSNFSWEEQHLYGSSRLGMLTPKLTVSSNMNTDAYTSVGDHTQDDGNRLFELTNHLGNVLATISDKLIPKPGDANNPAYTDADVVTAQEYYPFGMGMPGRSYSIGKNYRYGFNGKENDNEVKGNGNQIDYGNRIYDPRLGRFTSVDPLQKKFPALSSYQFCGDNPIATIDLDGLEPAAINKGTEALVLILQGYGANPPDNNTQASNAAKTNPNLGPDKALGSITSSGTKLQVVVYASSQTNNTKTDVLTTIKNFRAINPNGKVILVGHSGGADNIVELAKENKDIKINLMITLDVRDPKQLGWTDTNIPSNVENEINYYQNTDKLNLVSDRKMDFSKETKGVNILSPGSNHRSIDNDQFENVIKDINNELLNRNPVEEAKKRAQPVNDPKKSNSDPIPKIPIVSN